jgi:hypothetical protein
MKKVDNTLKATSPDYDLFTDLFGKGRLMKFSTNIDDFIIEGKNGYLVEPNNSLQLSEKIIEFSMHNALWILVAILRK